MRAGTDGSFHREEVVTPSTCGHNSLFAGRLGDWTWDAVSAACGLDAYRAHDDTGIPTYLSFHYFRIRGSADLHPLMLTFGDRLAITSTVFGLGSESLLTTHEVERDGAAIHVENVNRWISRSRPDTNRDLVRAVPAGYDHHRLTPVPQDRDPRRDYTAARRDQTFRPGDQKRTALRLDYEVEASRDLNGVGLLYFASYFSVVDWAVVRLWRHLGRGTGGFLGRAVLDHQLLYLGNADADTVLAIEVTTRDHPDGNDHDGNDHDGNDHDGDHHDGPGTEVVDTVIRDRDTGDVLAISTQLVTRGEKEDTAR